MSKVAFGLFLALAGSAVTAQPGSGVPQSQSRLDDWIESQFTAVGSSCVQGFKVKKNKSVTPSRVLHWNAVESRLGQRFRVYPTASVEYLFREVFEVKNGSLNPIGETIGVPWSGPLPPVMDGGLSEGRQDYNCVTMLAANGELELKVSQMQAALAAGTSGQQSQTAFVFAGNMVSPIAWALGKSTTTLADIPGVSTLGVRLALWHWYRNRPTFAARTDLAIRNKIDGMAFYIVEGLTQETMLKAEGDFRFSLPYLSGKAGAKWNVQREVVGKVKDYSVMLFADVDTATLDSAVELAKRSPVRLQPAPGNISKVEDDGPFNVSADVADVPPSLCSDDFWKLDGTGPSGNRASLDDLRVTYEQTSGDTYVCRFTARAKPPAPGGSTVVIALPVVSEIQLDKSSVLGFRMRLPEFAITDTRASFSLSIRQAPVLVLDERQSAPVKFSLVYDLIEKNEMRAEKAAEGSTSLSMSCGEEIRTLIPSGAVRRAAVS